MARILTTTQAAEHFGVNIKTIRRWIQNGKLVGERIDNRWHVRIKDNEERIEDSEGSDNTHDDREYTTQDDPDTTKNGAYTVQALQAKLEQATSENALLREQIERLHQQLTEKDNQLSRRDETISELTRAVEQSQKLIDHAQQLAAMAQKQSAALTERIEALEDLRNRPWWKRLFGR